MALIEIGSGAGGPQIVDVDHARISGGRGVVDGVAQGVGQSELQTSDASSHRGFQAVIDGRSGLFQAGNGANPWKWGEEGRESAATTRRQGEVDGRAGRRSASHSGNVGDGRTAGCGGSSWNAPLVEGRSAQTIWIAIVVPVRVDG